MKVDLVEVRGETRLSTLTGYAAREVMKSVPGARWLTQARSWTYPALYPSVLSVGVAAERIGEQLEPTPEALEWAKSEAAVWAALAEQAGSVRGNRPEFVQADGVPFPTFFPHQEQCSDWLASDGAHGGRLDASETGSGKTRSVLRGAWLCWEKGERGILLVSTLSAVKYGWGREVEQISGELPFSGGQEWQVFVLRGTAPQRRKQLAEAVEANEAAGGVGVVLLVNHEQLRLHSRMSGYGDTALRRCPKCGGPKEGKEVVKESSCQAHERDLNFVPFVAIALDECHRLMNPQAQATRSAWYLGDHAPRVWGLTGTPGSTDVVENTWALLRLVVGSAWPPKSKWCEYFAQVGYNSEGYWAVGNLKPEREEEFHKSYGALVRRVLKAQVLDLPPLLRGGPLERYVEMGKEQKALYDEMLEELRISVKEGDVTASNLLVQMTRLIQLAQATGKPGPHYGELIRVEKLPNGEEREIYNSEMILTDPSCKVDEVVDMVLEGDIAPGTVFQFVSRQLLYLVRDKLVAKKAIGRADDFGVVAGDVSEAARGIAIERFQSGKIPYFAFTAAAGGAGITLTRANTMVAVERPWSPILWKQAQDRVHRIGSEIHESISVIDLITAGTVEERQLAAVIQNQEALESIVKDREKLAALLEV